MSIFLDKYWNRRIGGQPPGYSVDASGDIPLGGLGWIETSADELLRTYFNPLLSVHVQPTGGPTPLWWNEASVYALAWWTDASDTTFYEVDSDYDGLLVVERLEMTYYVDISTAGHYVVQWKPSDGTYSARTGRKPQGGVTDPVVNFGLQVSDPALGIIDDLHSGTEVTVWALEETLWGQPT